MVWFVSPRTTVKSANHDQTKKGALHWSGSCPHEPQSNPQTMIKRKRVYCIGLVRVPANHGQIRTPWSNEKGRIALFWFVSPRTTVKSTNHDQTKKGVLHWSGSCPREPRSNPQTMVKRKRVHCIVLVRVPTNHSQIHKPWSNEKGRMARFSNPQTMIKPAYGRKVTIRTKGINIQSFYPVRS